MKPKYSGDKSRKFWHRIAEFSGTPRHSALYEAGCKLQELEAVVLKAIDESEKQKAQKTKYASKKKKKK